MSLQEIELLTKEHADDRALLGERVTAFNDEAAQVRRRKLPGIRGALSKAKDSKLRLQAAIDAHRELFAKPRTRVFHGIKVGIQKERPKLLLPAAEQLIKLIKKYFAEQVDVLVRTTEKPVKAAIANLSADDLKKIGCTMSKGVDAVFIEPADSDVDKLVEALMKDGTEEEDEE